MTRLRYNHYSGFQISPGKFIDYLVRPKIMAALQSLLGQEKCTFAKLAKECPEGFTASTHEVEAYKMMEALFKEDQTVDNK
jgi:hypothetical protein